MEPTENKHNVTGYSEVNGLKMYYEIYGEGKPLVLIHGGGSTIQTSFARIIPLFAKHRQVIGVELQAHGRTNDRNKDLAFEQDADDVASLLKNLQIHKADFLGFSNGGQTAIEIALRHPEIVNKIILCSSFINRSAAVPQFWEMFEEGKVKFSEMPQALKNEFLKVNNDPTALLNMFHKDVKRMRTFKGWTDEQIRSIKVPVFVTNADTDVGSPEHAVEMFRLFPNARLSMFPGTHGAYLGEISTGMENSKIPELAVSMIEEFLDEPIS
jgi:pimeloyl-ACP methyl ester carboxylesterase